MSYHQLALSIFEDVGLMDVAVADAPVDFGFEKSDELIDVPEMSLVCRRAINAIHFIVAENPSKGMWDVDLGYFKWLSCYDRSRNDPHLRKALRDAQGAAILISVVDPSDANKDIFASVPLLGTFVMQGGRLRFKVPDEIARLLKVPTKASYLSLRIGGAFSKAYAYSLYERLLRYRAAGETGWLDVEKVRSWFKVQNKKSLQEYKFLKRDVLLVAMQQINERSDLLVSIEEKREMRRVTMINFLIRPNPTFSARALSEESDMQRLYETLSEEFGLSASDFDEILSKRDTYTNKRLEQVMELVRHRRLSQDIRRPSAYFMKMLREGVVLSATEKEVIQRGEDQSNNQKRNLDQKRNQDTSADNEREQMLQHGETLWSALSDEERADRWNKYARSAIGKAALKRTGLTPAAPPDEALEHAIIRNALFSSLTTGKGGRMAAG